MMRMTAKRSKCVKRGGRQPAELSEAAAAAPSDSALEAASRSSSRRARLEQLAGELLELLRAHEYGVLVTELMLVYREHFNRGLDPSDYGFNTLSGVLYCLSKRLAFAREPEGVYVRDPSAPPPQPRPRPPRIPTPPPLPEPYYDDPLPGIPPAPDLFAPDCMQLQEPIPGLDLSGVCRGAMLQVEVAQVYSPSHFWLQRLGAAYSGALDTLSDDMQHYYTRGEGRSRVLPRGAAILAQYCAALYQGNWHRALIVKELSTEEVKVRYVDYGTVSKVNARTLKPLLRRYAELAAQAVRARLTWVRPAAAARRWDHSATQYFCSLVLGGKPFYANVFAADQEEVTLETLLVDTSGEDDVLVSTELVRAGYADECADIAQGSGESYLLPRWEPLEAGDTPSLEEVNRYLAAGIELDILASYSRHVASALPPPELPPAELPPPELAPPELPPPELAPPELPPAELPPPELTPPPSPSLLKD